MPVKYHAKALSTFHQINAFEQDGFLMLDMCCSDDGQAINNFLVQNLRQSGEALDEVMFFLKVIVHPKMKISSLITHLMSFQTHKTFIHLRNTNEDIFEEI